MTSPFPKSFTHTWIDTLGQRYRVYQRPPHAYGMTTDNELCLLETYAREQFKGHGTIVDLGCWYGATTLSLARGLAANGQANSHRTVQALDLFRWEAWMDPIAEQVSLPKRYVQDQSFYEDVKDLLSVYGGLINVERQDLAEYKPPQTPIELLFIDAMKSWALAQQIVSAFFPLLIAGESYVVQQDFAYYFAEIATNHLIMWYLRDHFRWVHHVPHSCSVVFVCTKRPDPSTLPVFTPSQFTSDMIEEAYEYSIACVSPDMRTCVEVAKLNFLIEQGHRSSGIRQMERIARSPNQLTEPMLIEVKRVAVKGAEMHVVHDDWLGDIITWVASMLTRIGAAPLQS